MLTSRSHYRQLAVVTACWFVTSTAWTREITFAWDAGSGSVGGYNIHYGDVSESYVTTVWVGDQTMVTLDLPPGAYFFAVTTVDASGQIESEYSNEVFLEWLNVADLSVSLTNNQLNTPPGSTATYDIIVANLGPEDNTGSVLTEAFDASFDMPSIVWSCAPNSGARPDTDCPTAGIGTELSNGVPISIEAGDAVSFTVQAPILSGVAGVLTSHAYIGASPAPPPDPNRTNNDDADIDVLTGDPCDEVVTLSNYTITSTEVLHACDTVRLEDDVRLSSSGLLVLRAGRQIAIQNGFSVESNASFICEIHPSLAN